VFSPHVNQQRKLFCGGKHSAFPTCFRVFFNFIYIKEVSGKSLITQFLFLRVNFLFGLFFSNKSKNMFLYAEPISSYLDRLLTTLSIKIKIDQNLKTRVRLSVLYKYRDQIKKASSKTKRSNFSISLLLQSRCPKP
jgi:hypothetical protein